MPNVSLTTTPRFWREGYSTNLPVASANDGDVATISTTVPAANTLGVHHVAETNLAKLVFFGAGAENAQFYANIYGFAPVNGGTSTQWVPTLIARLLCTLSNVTGVAGQLIVDTDRFCDSISLIEGDPTIKIVSDVNNRIASVLVDLEGSHYLAVKFDWTSLASQSTNANFLFATL
jgi:hypothetical protein